MVHYRNLSPATPEDLPAWAGADVTRISRAPAGHCIPADAAAARAPGAPYKAIPRAPGKLLTLLPYVTTPEVPVRVTVTVYTQPLTRRSECLRVRLQAPTSTGGDNFESD